MSDLKSKLAAKAAAERKQQAEGAEDARKYHEIVLREYPRLCNELLARVRARIGEIDGVQIDEHSIEQSMVLTHGNLAAPERTHLGNVRVPAVTVSIVGQKRLTFTPAGLDMIVGAHGVIEVVSTRGGADRIFMVSDKDPSRWVLAVRNPAPQAVRNWTVEFTDDLLDKLIEQALL